MAVITVDQQAEALITQGSDILNATEKEGQVPFETFHPWRAACRSFLLLTFGEKNPYLKVFEETVRDDDEIRVKTGMGILRAALVDIRNGHSIIWNGWVTVPGGGTIRIFNGHAII